MKKLLLLLCAGPIFTTTAQTAFTYHDSVSINHIKATVLLHGDLWLNPISHQPSCEYPKNTGKQIGYADAIWVSGYDESNKLHVTAQTYRTHGNDYWPGPLNASDTLTYAESAKWAHFWKVRQSDLQLFQAIPVHTTANTPPGILTWPATGNAYAAGDGMAALSIPAGTAMAPFVDMNSNGIYEPLLGDYPAIKGDEAIWWVFSDNGPTHNNTHGLPLGVEVHAMSYAYSRGTLIDNVVYYEYTIINKSAHTYSDCRISNFSDPDLGVNYDDYIGFDSAKRMSITYNGHLLDTSSYIPINKYGAHVPVQGTTVIVMPGDAGTNYTPAGSFINYNGDFSSSGDPNVDTQYDHYMRGLKLDGSPFMNTFVTPAQPTIFMYPGDPANASQWSECSQNTMPGDRRSVLSTSNFTLTAGTTVKYVMALVVTDTNQGGCPAVGLGDIRTVADTAWGNYYNPPPVVPSGISNVTYAGNIKLYPNPANSLLHIDVLNGVQNTGDFTVHNTLGQLLNIAVKNNGSNYEADISILSLGVYYLSYSTGGTINNVRFVKQ